MKNLFFEFKNNICGYKAQANKEYSNKKNDYWRGRFYTINSFIVHDLIDFFKELTLEEFVDKLTINRSILNTRLRKLRNSKISSMTDDYINGCEDGYRDIIKVFEKLEEKYSKNLVRKQKIIIINC